MSTRPTHLPRQYLAACVAAAISALLGTPRPAQAAATVVYPTGTHPADVQAVQNAVSAGGVVILKAVNQVGEPTAFNFGPPTAGSGTVFLTTDVEIRGERHRSWNTTIQGGDTPFRGLVAVRTAFKGLHFNQPRVAAILLLASSGTEISDNVITRVTGFPWTSAGDRKGQGVWILGEPGGGLGPVTGTVTIARNRIADIDAEDGLGLALVGFEADTKVIGNDIRGTNFIGILTFIHSGQVWIEGNTVIPGPARFPGPYSTGIGIQVGPLFAEQNTGPTQPAHIVNNYVLTENPNADGIVLYGFERPLNESRVVANRVTMRESLFGGVTVYDNVSRTFIGANRIEGTSAAGIVFFAFDFSEQRGNVIAANQLQQLHPTDEHLYLGEATAETLVIGCHGTVTNLGTDNRFVGCLDGLSLSLAQRRGATPTRSRLGDLLRLDHEIALKGLP